MRLHVLVGIRLHPGRGPPVPFPPSDLPQSREAFLPPIVEDTQ
jgi:hypothetical protein